MGLVSVLLDLTSRSSNRGCRQTPIVGKLFFPNLYSLAVNTVVISSAPTSPLHTHPPLPPPSTPLPLPPPPPSIPSPSLHSPPSTPSPCTHNPRKSLLSLDLSHNHLSSLPSTLHTLTVLTTLTNLLLVGDPLTVSTCIHTIGKDTCMQTV